MVAQTRKKKRPPLLEAPLAIELVKEKTELLNVMEASKYSAWNQFSLREALIADV